MAERYTPVTAGGTEVSKVSLDRVKQLGESPRFWRLNRLEEYYEDAQDDGCEDDYLGRRRPEGGWKNWTPPTSAPFGAAGTQDQIDLRSAKPHSRYALAGIIVHEFTAKVLGTGRFPKAKAAGDRDAEDYIEAAEAQMGAASTWIEARNKGGSMGSVLVLLGVKQGEFRLEVVNAKLLKDDEIKWADRDAWVPASVVIQYKFWAEVRDERTGRMTPVQFWYRREISDKADVTYRPQPVGNGDAPVWDGQVDPERNYTNDIGVFPGVFIQNTKNSVDLDGDADFKLSMPAIDEINRILSQSSRALRQNLHPELVVSTDKKGGQVKRGVGQVIAVEKGGDAKLIAIPTEPFDVAEKRLERLRSQGLEESGCVILDSEKVSGSAQSAEAMEFLYAKMLDRCQVLREQYGAAIARMRRIILLMGRKYGADIKLPLKEVRGADGKVTGTVPRQPGKAEVVTNRWGPYFPPTIEDIEKATRAASVALTTGAMDEETAATFLAPYYGIEDVSAFTEKLKARKNEIDQQRAQKFADAIDRGGRGGGGGFGGGGREPGTLKLPGAGGAGAAARGG